MSQVERAFKGTGFNGTLMTAAGRSLEGRELCFVNSMFAVFAFFTVQYSSKFEPPSFESSNCSVWPDWSCKVVLK